MKRAAFRLSGLAIVIVMAVLTMTGLALAKSLYVIADTNSYPNPTPLKAYNINPDGTLTFQAEYPLSGAAAAVGVAVDTGTDTLFITCEGSNIISLVDAKTMTSIGSTTAAGATDLAGIVVDDTKNRIYAVDRYSSKLFVYAWDPDTKLLELKKRVALADMGGLGAFGIALDKNRGLLYVANFNYGYAAAAATTIPYAISYYHTSDWTLAGTLDLAGPAIGIAVDYVNQLLYSGAGWGGYSRLDYFNLQDDSKGGLDLGSLSGAMGIAVDEETGLIYLTTGYAGDELRVYKFNADTGEFRLLQNLGVIGGAPAGLDLGAGYNPLNLAENTDPPTVNPGQNLTYTLSFDNLNNPQSVVNVSLSDNLAPETVFVSASDGGVYDAESHAVTWNVGDLPPGASTRTVQLVTRVRGRTPEQTNLKNTATISSDSTPPTTMSMATLVVVTPFSLTFPVEGYTPYDAPVICVLDHSVYETKPVKFYVNSGQVKAFNGEVAESTFGANKLEGYWDGYKNSTGTNFLSGVLNYVENPFLYYDGHPGYDYRVPKGSRILATADGELFIADTDRVNGGGYQAYKTFYIKHTVTSQGRFLNYYYTYYLYVKLTRKIKDQISATGSARVKKGQLVGWTYNNWIHVDFRRKSDGHASIYDPYKAKLWDVAAPAAN